ncbi:MAG: NAD(P)H-dependent glycerol-3-phosphate dehydrogenase [Nanobdellota archaeon]
MQKIAILGAGAFGFAIAKLIGENHMQKEIALYDVNPNFISHIESTREHPVFHESVKLPENIVVTKDLKEAVDRADLVVLAIPTKFFRDAIGKFKALLKDEVIFLNLAKGLELNTNMRISQIIEQELSSQKINYKICVLSGGMIAREVTLQNPLCAELACTDKQTAKAVARLLWSDYLRIETTDDVIGVGLAGAFKNVIAIGAGIFDGLNYGESSKSAFVSAAAMEIQNLALCMGAKKETFGPGTQAWFGDLMTTCFGASRNRELGEFIGKGMSVNDAVDSMLKENKSIEGYLTTGVVHSLSKNKNIKTPLLNDIYNVLYNGKKPLDFVKHFIKEW